MVRVDKIKVERK